MEDIAYRRMIDLYYLDEGPLPRDVQRIAKLIRMREHEAVISAVLKEFFTETDDGWFHARCEDEIAAAADKRLKAQASAAASVAARRARVGQPPNDGDADDERSQSERSTDVQRSLIGCLAPNPNPNPNPNPRVKDISTHAGYPQEFEEAWRAYPDRPGASKRDAFKAWSARVKAGADPAAITAGVDRYAAYCRATATEPKFIKQPATFFGPGEHYTLDWKPPANQQGRRSAYDQRAAAANELTGRNREARGAIEGNATRVD